VNSTHNPQITPLTTARFLAVLLIGIGMVLVPLPGETRFWSELQNAGHSLAFMALTLGLHQMLFKRLSASGLPRYLILAVLLLVLGIGIELIQIYTQRDASPGDVLHDLAGIAAGSLLHWSWFRTPARRPRYRSIFTGVALLLICISFYQPITLGVARLIQTPMPMLADFETAGSLKYVGATGGATLAVVPAPVAWQAHDSAVLRVTLAPPQYAGVHWLEPDSDWRAYTTLHMQLFNPGESLRQLVIRVHDRQHNQEADDRFTQTLELPPGETHITVSLDDVRQLNRSPAENPDATSRKMNMAEIAGIIIYAEDAEPGEFFLDNLQLR